MRTSTGRNPAPAVAPSDPSGYRIGDIELDIARRRATRGSQEIGLSKLSYELLLVLAEAAPGVVTQVQLAERVWNGRYVSPATMKQRVVLLRKALGDRGDQPTYISVVRGQGYRLIPRVEKIDLDHRPRSASLAFAITIIAAILVGVIAAGYLATSAPGGRHGVAVMPFENLSPDPAASYFTAGLHEEVINRLDRFEELRVIPRSSSERFAGRDTGFREIALELDVNTIVDGTIRYSDDRVRVSAQLIDADSGNQVWSRTFEHDRSDVLETQKEIASSVAGSLAVTLGIGDVDEFRGAGTASIEAYDAYNEGIRILSGEGGQERAISFFRRATELDPDYAAAWAHLGYSTMAKAWTAPADRSREILDEAYPLVARAVELDPDSARVLTSLANVSYARMDWVAAERYFSRAIDILADRSTLSQRGNMLMRAGRLGDARSDYRAAEFASPGDPAVLRVHVALGQARYAEARELAALEDRPVLRNRLLLGIALNERDPATIKTSMRDMIATEIASNALYVPLMRNFEGGEALATIRRVHSDESLQWRAKAADIALLAAYFGDQELALESLASEVRLSTTRLWTLWYPLMSEARKLPAFRTLVAELNLVDYWRTYGWPDTCIPLGEAEFTCS